MKGKHLFMLILFLLGILWVKGLMSQPLDIPDNYSIEGVHEEVINVNWEDKIIFFVSLG